MSGALSLAADRTSFVVSDDAPRWCRDLNMNEAEARDIFERGKLYTIAPARLEKIGLWVVGVRCAGLGCPFVVKNYEGARYGIFPRWGQAATLMVELACGYEAAIRDLGKRPMSRKPANSIRLSLQRRREVITAFKCALADPLGSQLTAWEIELTGSIADVLHSRQQKLSDIQFDHIARIMAKLTGSSR